MDVSLFLKALECSEDVITIIHVGIFDVSTITSAADRSILEHSHCSTNSALMYASNILQDMLAKLLVN